MENLEVLFYGDKYMETKYIPFLFRDMIIPKGKKIVVISECHIDHSNPDKDPVDLSLEISDSKENLLFFCCSMDKEVYYKDIKIIREKFLELIFRENVVFLNIPFNKREIYKEWQFLLKRIEE